MRTDAVKQYPESKASLATADNKAIPPPIVCSVTRHLKTTEWGDNILSRFVQLCTFIGGLCESELTQFVNSNLSVFLQGVHQLNEFGLKLRHDAMESFKRQTNSIAVLGCKLATVENCISCFSEEVLVRVEFERKMIKHLVAIPIDDQVALFRSQLIDSILLAIVKRSIPLHQLILLFDEINVIYPNSAKSASASVPGFDFLFANVMEDLIEPYEELQIDSFEQYCLRIISYLSPELCSHSAKCFVKKSRLAFLLILENYVNAKPLKTPGRLASLLMYIRTVQSVGQKIREQYWRARQSGLLPADALLDDAFKEPRASWEVLGHMLVPMPPTELNLRAEGVRYSTTRPGVNASSSTPNNNVDVAELQPSVEQILKPDEEFGDWAVLYLT